MIHDKFAFNEFQIIYIRTIIDNNNNLTIHSIHNKNWKI